MDLDLHRMSFSSSYGGVGGYGMAGKEGPDVLLTLRRVTRTS
jgi:hypothetical protein